MKIAVFCASSDAIAPVYFEAAHRLGERIGEKGWHLVYGGTDRGLMRELAETVMSRGGEVTGIIPECIVQRGVAAQGLKRLVVTADMKERKQLLREEAEAFIALPGGWGTLEEITEVITLKQLGQHNRPIVFLNIAGYYDPFFAFIRQAQGKHFISAVYDELYQVVNTVEEALRYIQDYQPVSHKEKY